MFILLYFSPQRAVVVLYVLVLYFRLVQVYFF